MIAKNSSRAEDLAYEAAIHLEGKAELFLEEHLLRSMRDKGGPNFTCSLLSPEKEQIEVVLVFGGDGTILRAARDLDGFEVPICGVNLGRLGFLSQVEPKDLEADLKKLINDDFEISRRMKLDAYLSGQELGSALNEVLVIGSKIGKIFRANLEFGSLGRLKLEGDGVILSTPTGSTGHSLSAGACVVDWDQDAIVVAPLGAMEPSRGLVMSADKEVMVFPGDDCSLAIDGRIWGEVNRGSEIKVKRSNSRTAFVSFDSDPFWKKLRERIGG